MMENMSMNFSFGQLQSSRYLFISLVTKIDSTGCYVMLVPENQFIEKFWWKLIGHSNDIKPFQSLCFV